MLACVGVYFYLVMAYFQSVNNTFVVEELEMFKDPNQTPYYVQSDWINAFLITAGVSFSLSAQ